MNVVASRGIMVHGFLRSVFEGTRPAWRFGGYCCHLRGEHVFHHGNQAAAQGSARRTGANCGCHLRRPAGYCLPGRRQISMANPASRRASLTPLPSGSEHTHDFPGSFGIEYQLCDSGKRRSMAVRHLHAQFFPASAKTAGAQKKNGSVKRARANGRGSATPRARAGSASAVVESSADLNS